jgi:signal transduction histidine kinase
MVDLYRKKYSVIIKTLLSSENTEKFFEKFIQSLIDQFGISFCFFYSRVNGFYELSKIWNNKVTNFPKFANDDNVIRTLEKNKYIYFKDISGLEKEEALKDSDLYSSFKNLSVSLAVLFEVNDKKQGILLFGNKENLAEFSTKEIGVINDLIHELETVLPDFNALKGEILGDKLNIIEPTLSLISHDLRNPIQMMSILTEMLQAKELSIEKRKNLYNKFSDGLSQVTSIISEVTEFVKGSYQLNYEKVDSKKYFDEIRNSVSDALKKLKIELELDLNYNGSINIDAKRLKNIILKLIKFSRDLIQYEGLISIKVLCEKDNIVISIQDTSEGLSQEILENLYDPFLVFGNKKGIGLSFPITKKIIEQHNGSFEIKSSQTEGLKYIIIIPIGL